MDIDERDFTIDVGQVEAAITPRTKAIMPVSLYGQPADMPAIVEIADRHGLAVVEDACQAHGAAIGDRHSGTWGAGTFSFYPTKNMTTGEGGMLTTDDGELAERVRLLREHGMKVRYHHDVVGYNFRMTDLAASIGLAQLPKLAGYNERRRAIASRYDAELIGVDHPVRPRRRDPRVPPVHDPGEVPRRLRRSAPRARRGKRHLLPDPGSPPEAVPRASATATRRCRSPIGSRSRCSASRSTHR